MDVENVNVEAVVTGLASALHFPALTVAVAVIVAHPNRSRQAVEVGTCSTTTPSAEFSVTRAFSTSEEFQNQWSLPAMPRMVR